MQEGVLTQSISDRAWVGLFLVFRRMCTRHSNIPRGLSPAAQKCWSRLISGAKATAF